MVYPPGMSGYEGERWVYSEGPTVDRSGGSGATAGVPGFSDEISVPAANTVDPPRVDPADSATSTTAPDRPADEPAGVTVRLTTTISPELLEHLRDSVKNFTRTPVRVEVRADQASALTAADVTGAEPDGDDGWLTIR